MRKPARKTGNILELLAQVRTYKALDRSARRDHHYRSTLKRQDRAFAALSKAGLNKEQLLIVDNAITVTNECGAAYGEVAYRLGFRDSKRLITELDNIK